MKRALVGGFALLVSAFAPVAPPELISSANAQPAPGSPCAATNKIGDGFQWGSAYIVPGPYDYRIDFGSRPDEGPGVAAFVTARSDLTIRCPVLNGGKSIGKYGTSTLRRGETLIEIVCDENGITEAGLQLKAGIEPCVAGGSWDNR
jgi:hypothetical protein